MRGQVLPSDPDLAIGVLGQPDINAAGTVGVLADFAGPGVTAEGVSMIFFARLDGGACVGADNHAVVKSGPGGLTILVREGDPAPGGTIGLGGGKLRVTPAGDVVFDAVPRSPGAKTSGIFALEDGALRIVALDADPTFAAGETAPVNLTDVEAHGASGGGISAFIACIEGMVPRFALVAAQDGVLEALPSEVDVLEMRPGDFRTIQSFGASVQNDPWRFDMNAMAQIPSGLTFPDGSAGQVLPDPFGAAAVPLRGSAGLLALCLAGLGAVGRSR